jgi:magnesium transporter
MSQLSSVPAAVEPVLPGVPWFDLEDPNSSVLDELAKRYSLHELQIEDCRHGHQRAKTEEHQGYIFSVLKHLHLNARLSFDDFDIFLGRDFLITVHEGCSDVVTKVKERVRNEKVKRLDRLYYMLVDTIVDQYLPVLDQLAEQISKLEDEVLKRPSPDVLAKILRLRRKLIEMRRVSTGMREVVNTLMRRERGLLGDDLDPYFRDVFDHLVRTVDLIETYRDLLTSSLDVYMSSIANRTNDIMKVLTIYGTMALPLVIITGFFGMNLNLPWQESPWGAFFATLAMLLSAGLVLLYFRRRNWL